MEFLRIQDMWSLFLFILFFLCFNLFQTEGSTIINGACVDCHGEILVPGGGSSAAAPVLRQLGFSFRLVEPSIEVDFTSENFVSAMGRLQSACRKSYQYDFAALDCTLKEWEDEHPLLSNDLDSVPIVAYANVITYNLPGITANVDPDLFVSRQNLYDILYGEITMWNDPRLIKTNPLLADRLPNQNITVVLTTDASGAAGSIMTMLSNIVGNETEYDEITYPPSFFALPNRIPVQGSIGVIAALASIPYSIGFVPQSYTDEAGLPDAHIENRSGKYVKAGENYGVYLAIQTAQLTGSLEPADQWGDETYPLGQMVHLLYHKDVDAGCDSRIAMAKFIYWMLTSEDAITQIYANSGFVSLPEGIVNHVIEKIGNLKCENRPLLLITFNDYGNDALTQTITIFASVLIVISVVILSTLSYKRNNRITKAAGLAFAGFFLLGCIFNYLSVIFWATIPDNTSICIGRYAFVTIGYALILGAMFAKCWEISKIFYRAEQGDISPFKELPWWMFCRAFFAVVFFELLILLIWLVVDPPRSTIEIIDKVNHIAIHECTTEYPEIWYGINFIYFGIVLVWGAYLSYLTKDIWQKYNYPNESRSILLSIYNLAFCCVILVPLVTALDTSPEVLFFLISVAIIFPTTFALIIVHGPKILAFLATSISKGSRGRGSKVAPQTRSRDKDTHDSHGDSHTVKILKNDQERERERSLVDDPSGRHVEIQMTPINTKHHLKGIKSIEDPKIVTEGKRQFPIDENPSSHELGDSDETRELVSDETRGLVSQHERKIGVPLGSAWKVLTPITDGRVDSPTSAFDAPETTNPLFGENV